MKIQPINSNYKISYKKTPKRITTKSEERFSKKEASKHFVKGALSPFVMMAKHPFKTLGAVAISACVYSVVPIMAPVTAIGVGILGLGQLAKGSYQAIRNYKNKDYDKAEQSFEKIGQGTLTTALTALGMRSGAKTIREAKFMNEYNLPSVNKAHKLLIAKDVKYSNYIDIVKENFSLVTTKDGLKLVGSQLKPSNIKLRMTDLLKFLFREKEQVDSVKSQRKNFKSTKESEYRAQRTTKDIKAETQKLAEEIFDELEIDKESRPKVKVIQDDISETGSYIKDAHAIEVNENSYRAGSDDLSEVIAHEARHAKESILRNHLTEEQKIDLIKQYLQKRINDGDSEYVITALRKRYADLDLSPKMNAKMKTDFAKLASENLYQTEKMYTNSQLRKMVKPLVESNEEFLAEYASKTDALRAVTKYARSQQERFKIFKTICIDELDIPTQKITPELLKRASESFFDDLECTENTIMFDASDDFLYNYVFSKEEVRAENFGVGFKLKGLKRGLKEVLKTEPNNLEKQARIMNDMKIADYRLEYLDTGSKYFELYNKSRVKSLNLLEKLKFKLMKKDMLRLVKASDKFKEVTSDNKVYINEYTQFSELKRHPIGQSVYVPYNVVAKMNEECPRKFCDKEREQNFGVAR